MTERITLKTLAQATEQQVFDQVARHLLKQNEQSTNGVLCCYRSSRTGQMCAAGCLIGDDEYLPATFEGRLWVQLIVYGTVPDVHGELIALLQDVHDGHHPALWKETLAKLAYDRGLSPAVLEET